MKKYIVLSVNSNPDYLYFTPITCWSWRQFGWEPILMYHGDPGKLDALKIPGDDIEVVHVREVAGYRSDTITQVSRLYAAKAFDGYLMTGDIDMLPLSNYWKPNFDEITVWGSDLTGYKHFPICYIGMQAGKWREVMKIDGISLNAAMERDLKSLPQAKDPDFYKYWFSDQDLITERLAPYNPVQIKRGQYSNGLAVGRVDRAAWTLELDTFIDAHLFQQVYHKGREQYFEKMMELLKAFWPDEDFKWVYDYTNEFRKLTGHA